MIRRLLGRDKPKPGTRPPGQEALLQAVRLQNNKELGTIIAGSSIDDLEWFLQALELQLEETPHHVKDQKVLAEIQAWHRRARTATMSTLHNKRIRDRPRKWALQAGEKLLYIGLGVVIAELVRLALH